MLCIKTILSYDVRNRNFRAAEREINRGSQPEEKSDRDRDHDANSAQCRKRSGCQTHRLAVFTSSKQLMKVKPKLRSLTPGMTRRKPAYFGRLSMFALKCHDEEPIRAAAMWPGSHGA